ncbi:MAG: DinB family protein [Chitinophagaceae bacterium]
MITIAKEAETIMIEYLSQLNSITEDEWIYKPSPTKWSKKELIGHMIDSAENNIRRFIVAQYEESPTIIYNQDKWVSINNYQQWDTQNLIQLWYLLNKQIADILKNTSDDIAQRTVQSEVLHSIEWLAQDYIKHLKHHLHQVLNLETVAYP